MRLLFFVLLFYGCLANTECFFPETELRPFFYEVTSNTPSETTIADSLVDPPDAHLRLASIRSNNLPLVNYTDRFTLVSEQTGRFRLISLAPLSLPSYPSSITETLLYVTVVCNGRPFPLMTIRLKAANSVAPSFLNEPYVVEVDENFSLGREVETPIAVIDWDPSPSYGVRVELENNTSLELASYPGGPPAGFEDGLSWSKAQYPQQFTLRLIGPISYPMELKLKATDDGSPQHVTFTTIKVVKRLKNVPLFSKCHISATIPENSKKGTKVTTIPIQNYSENTQLRLVDPDGTFEIVGDELLVADPKLMDRELFSTLEVVVENKSAEKGSAENCRRLRIRVELDDENDNRPVFERESYWFHLDEHVTPGTEFATLKARDVDVGPNGRVTYELVNSSVPFRIYARGRDTIMATTGTIGSEDQYRLVVEARDHGETAKVTPVVIEIFVVRPGRPVKEFEIKKQHNKVEKTITTTRPTTVRPVTFLSKDELINRAIDEATKEFEELVRAPENPQNARKPLYSTTRESQNEVILKTVLEKSRNDSLEREKPRKLPKESIALGVAQVTGRPRPHLRGLVPATSTTEKTESNNEVEEETEDLGAGSEEQTPFGFTANHYYYEVFGQPVEDDVFGRVVAEPNPQMYGLDRKASGIFKVDPDIGELSVARRLYLHASGNISFAVSATNGVSTARAVVTVLFEPDKDPKESQPRFDQTLYKFRVEEASSPEVIGIVRAFHTSASSRSSSTSLKYSIDGNDLPFSIHPTSGEIANESPLDREAHSTYRFNVRACLSNSLDVCGTSEVEVSVGDINDQTPRFSSSLVHITLPSDAPIGTEVTRVRAIDEDLGDNGAITYQLTAPSDVFAVDGETGRVVTVERLSDSNYILQIQAVDHGISPKSDVVELRIKVLGTNPSAPSFQQQQYSVIVTPPTPAGAVIAQVQATDPDPGQEGFVQYRFAQTEDAKEHVTQGKFEINRKTGVVSSVKSLTSGDGPFDLIVEAFDGSSSFSRKTSALLHVELGVEAALRFLPLPTTIYISTEKAVGSVILRASATTTSSSPVHFRILEDGSQFEMDGDLLRVVSHELVPGKTTLTIRAETESLLFSDHHLTIIAMDNSAKYPVFPQLTYDIDIPKESTYPQVVAMFSARVRNGTLSYELHPETPHLLALNSTTGELIVKSPDFASQNADTTFIVVRARNVFFPEFYSDVGVALNQVAQRPEIRFGQTVYRLEVAENTPVGSLVSHPLDIYPRSIPVRFRLTPADSFLGIHENGTIFVVKPIDLEQIGTSVLQFTTGAETDNGQKTSARLSVDLKDENEFSPEMAKVFVEGRIREDAPPGTVVAKIEATDKDFSEGKHLLYRIVGGSGKELVFVQEDGTLVLGNRPIVNTHMPTFDVQVEAYDKNGNKASAMALITVERSSNSNAPIIKNLPLKWVVKENDPTSKFTITTDSDGREEISYRIVKGNTLGNFKIDHQGNLSLTKSLDFEKESKFLLTLQAVNIGNRALITTFPVTVVVMNENESAPVFSQQNVSRRASVDSPIGKDILKISATDDDGDRLQYSISGPDCSSLNIDPLGVISWSAPPSKRPLGNIICQVTVFDGVHESTTNITLDIFSEVQPTKSPPNRAPVFSQTEYTFTAEGPSGVPIGRVIASDPDGDQVLLAIKPQEYRDIFAVDDHGYITLKKDAVDLDQSQYFFLVSAEDWGPPIMSSVVTVHVIVPIKVSSSVDAAETTQETFTTKSATTSTEGTTSERPKDKPISVGEHFGPEQGVQPIIKFIRPMYVYSIKSDSPVDSYLGQVHTTFNKDISFEMDGDGLLGIDEEGRIRTTKPLKEGKFNQTVVATTNGKRVAEVPVIVHVIGVTQTTATTLSTTTSTTQKSSESTTAEEGPSESSSTRKPLAFGFERPMYFVFVTEGNYTGLNLDIKPEPLATSTDGKVIYSISNKTETVPFYLTETGDFLCFQVDREQRQNYMLDIVATQGGEEAHTLLNVTVLDVNDNYPIIDGPDVIGVSNDAQIGSSVMTFKATDLDSGQSGQVSYDISGDASAYFTIDRSLGALSLSSSLASAPKELSLVVTARDQGRPPLKSQLPVPIQIFDSHSPAPLLPRLKENLLVPHNAAPGYLIKTLLAGPTTSSVLEPIKYGMTDDHYGLFKIEDGRLTLARPPFPLEGGRVHQLNVTAKNSLGTDTIIVNVLLESYEQSTTKQPMYTGSCKFEKNVYEVEISENQPAGIHVGTVKADCQNPVYSLSDNEDFSIDTYGQLYTKRLLDREQKSLHLVYINVKPSRTVRSDPIVENAKLHLQSNQAVIIIRVLDQNDNFPYFDHLVNGRLVAHVDWKARQASPVVRITAKDNDQDARLIFSMPNSDLFTVDPHTGIISLKRTLENESDDEFDITATVDDGEHQATVPITIYKLSPDTNIVRLTSELAPSRVREFQVENTLNELTGSESRVMAKGPIDGSRSAIYIYALDPGTKEPIGKERIVELLQVQKTALMASPSRISDVSISKTPESTMSVTHIVLLLLVLVLVVVLLCLTCWCASYCKRRRYTTSISDREYMFSTGGGPRPYDVEAITRQTAQTVLAQVTIPSPKTTHRDSAISPAFADRAESVKDFGNSVRERPGLLQSALSRHKIQPGAGSLSAVVVQKDE